MATFRGDEIGRPDPQHATGSMQICNSLSEMKDLLMRAIRQREVLIKLASSVPKGLVSQLLLEDDFPCTIYTFVLVFRRTNTSTETLLVYGDCVVHVSEAYANNMSLFVVTPIYDVLAFEHCLKVYAGDLPSKKSSLEAFKGREHTHCVGNTESPYFKAIHEILGEYMKKE